MVGFDIASARLVEQHGRKLSQQTNVLRKWYKQLRQMLQRLLLSAILNRMALDPSTLLTQIESAIDALLTGGASSYSIGNRSVTKLDLSELFEQRRMLQMEVARSNGMTSRLAKLRRPSQ